jgi:phosphomannomutase
MLRGDEVGALLAHHLLTGGHTGTYACSIVSSSLLGKLAAAAGQPFAETLTGFKWISKVEGLVFGYEEALGYCVDPEHVKDKDGVSALLLLCELAAAEKAQGRTLVDVLDDLALAHGLHATDQLSVRVTDPAEIEAAMKRLRSVPPTSLGGLRVESNDDLSRGDGGLPPTEGLRYRLQSGARVIVRPSGTEPKLKCYLEVVVPVDAEAGVDAARISAAARLDALRSDVRSAAGLAGCVHPQRTTRATTNATASAVRTPSSSRAVRRTTCEPSSYSSSDRASMPRRARSSAASCSMRCSTKSG